MTVHQFPRSPQVDFLLTRTAEVAPFLPANDDADSDLFPPAYIADGRELDRALRSLGLEGPRARSLPLRVAASAVAIYGGAFVGLMAMGIGAASLLPRAMAWAGGVL